MMAPMEHQEETEDEFTELLRQIEEQEKAVAQLMGMQEQGEQNLHEVEVALKSIGATSTPPRATATTVIETLSQPRYHHNQQHEDDCMERTMVDTVEDYVSDSFDSALSCCQWLQELAGATMSEPCKVTSKEAPSGYQKQQLLEVEGGQENISTDTSSNIRVEQYPRVENSTRILFQPELSPLEVEGASSPVVGLQLGFFETPKEGQIKGEQTAIDKSMGQELNSANDNHDIACNNESREMPPNEATTISTSSTGGGEKTLESNNCQQQSEPVETSTIEMFSSLPMGTLKEIRESQDGDRGCHDESKSLGKVGWLPVYPIEKEENPLTELIHQFVASSEVCKDPNSMSHPLPSDSVKLSMEEHSSNMGIKNENKQRLPVNPEEQPTGEHEVPEKEEISLTEPMPQFVACNEECEDPESTQQQPPSDPFESENKEKLPIDPNQRALEGFKGSEFNSDNVHTLDIDPMVCMVTASEERVGVVGEDVLNVDDSECSENGRLKGLAEYPTMVKTLNKGPQNHNQENDLIMTDQRQQQRNNESIIYREEANCDRNSQDSMLAHAITDEGSVVKECEGDEDVEIGNMTETSFNQEPEIAAEDCSRNEVVNIATTKIVASQMIMVPEENNNVADCNPNWEELDEETLFVHRHGDEGRVLQEQDTPALATMVELGTSSRASSEAVIVPSIESDTVDVQNTSCTPDSAMEMLLEEMEDYVKENNMKHYESTSEVPSLEKNCQHEFSSHAPEMENTPSLFNTPPREDSRIEGTGPHVVTPLPSPTPACPNESFESAQEQDSNDEGTSSLLPLRSSKRVSFADDSGLPLSEILHLESAPATEGRLVILLLSPAEHTFEFIQVEYPIDETTTTQVLVDQLTALTSNSLFQYTKFIGLSRIKSNEGEYKGTTENSPEEKTDINNNPSSTYSSCSSGIPTLLDPCSLLGDFNFHNCELILAVPKGYTPAQMVTISFPLLLNGAIVKALQSGRRSGRGLKSGHDWYKDLLLKRLYDKDNGCCNLVDDYVQRHTYREWAVVEDLVDYVTSVDIDLNDYVSAWEEMQELIDDDAKELTYNIEEKECAIDTDEGTVSSADYAFQNESPYVAKDPSSSDTTSMNYSQDESLRSVVNFQGSTSIDKKPVPLEVPTETSSSYVMPSTLIVHEEGLQERIPQPDPILWAYIGGKEGAERIIFSMYIIAVVGVFGVLSVSFD